MDREEIVRRVILVVSEYFDRSAEKITEKLSFAYLGTDSFDAIGIVMAIEEEFDIDIIWELEKNLTTIESVVNIVGKLLKQQVA